MIASIEELAAVLLQATLAAVLIAAGSAKLADVAGFVNTLVGLGLPGRRLRLVTTATYMVPFLEIGVGFLVVSRRWPVVASALVLAIVGSFTVVTGWALTRRPRVACRCFGSLTASQFSRLGLARNAALTVAAALVLWHEVIRAPTVAMPTGATVLVALGYGVFALTAVQAAKTLPILEEERRTA